MSEENPDPKWKSAERIPLREKYTNPGTAKSVQRKVGGGSATSGQKARAKARGHRGGVESPEALYERNQRRATDEATRAQTPRRFLRRFRGR